MSRSTSRKAAAKRGGRKKTRQLFGAHLSAAGGPHRAVERGDVLECDVLQIFTKNNNQWAAAPLAEDKVAAWRAALQASKILHPIAHASYLINLAAPDDTLWEKSIAALTDEMHRAETLGLEALVVHPGAYTSSDPETGLERVAEAASRVLDETANSSSVRLLLENTAGQGTCLGHSFEELGAMLDRIDGRQRVGICFDTCHAFAAGYELNTPAGFRDMIRALGDHLPLKSIVAVHCNDSKKGCGSRVDRHEHIGRGAIGDAGFRNTLADPVLGALPWYLETPKGIDEQSGDDWDAVNLRHLRELAES